MIQLESIAGQGRRQRSAKRKLSNSFPREVFMAKNFSAITGGEPRPDPVSMPSGLGEHGKALWRKVMKEYAVDDAGGVEMLFQICSAADMAARLRAQIDKEGVLVKTKAGPREHPLLKQELACRSFVVRGLGRLGLSVEPLRTAAGRPPGYA
jgi:hypothetical protein